MASGICATAFPLSETSRIGDRGGGGGHSEPVHSLQCTAMISSCHPCSQQSRLGEDTGRSAVDLPRRSDSLQYETALATASSRSRAVSSTTTAPLHGGAGDSLTALAFLSRLEILRRHLLTTSPLGAASVSSSCFLLGSCARAPPALERHSSFPAPKHSGEAEGFLCPADVMKVKWSVLDEEDEIEAADGDETESTSC